jgi:hypothetical protein
MEMELLLSDMVEVEAVQTIKVDQEALQLVVLE